KAAAVVEKAAAVVEKAAAVVEKAAAVVEKAAAVVEKAAVSEKYRNDQEYGYGNRRDSERDAPSSDDK
ncbi:MAG TPA: hypothetical protein VME23_14170, partial [Terracidiphilus sp.]|nr:hypothetical protein [Terracidiphilus sp.]